jgi:hypothetical protein
VTVEGLVSTLVFFILLTVVVQVGFLVIARSAASAAVQGAVRAASVDVTESVAIEERLSRDLAATVPGADNAVVSVTTDGRTVKGVVAFDWLPPGPDLIPVRIVVIRNMPVVVPP